MSLYEQWKDLIENQTDETFNDFWGKYSSTETNIYSRLLADYPAPVSGAFCELAEKYQADPVIFMGFLDGINTSIKEEQKLEDMTEESPVHLDVDYEKLYFNMHAAGADYLYGLSQWKDVLSEDKRREIEKAYKQSKTVVKEKGPGRNDPCPCGSGKKYKKCCGKDK